jgi:pyruvate dehydrogenase E2 component (dihydrolipoamide acetyltransferase)
MPHIIEMPKLTDTMTVGTVIKWLKQEGAAVKSGDMLAEVETDKAIMELESFFDGTLLKIFAPGGTRVALGSPLCAIGKAGESFAAPTSSPTLPAADEAPETMALGQVELPPSMPAVLPPIVRAPAPAAPSVAAEGGRLKVSPLARKLAAEKGIDLARVVGSGPAGRIVRADILAAESAPAANPGHSGFGARANGGPIQPERTIAVSSMRAAIGRRLVESKTQIPHFYLEVEIDASPLLALRQQLNAALAAEHLKLSVNDFMLKATAEALRRVPQVNSSWQGDRIQFFASAHVAFAVAIEDGLITPIIRDAHLKSVLQISRDAQDLARRAKERKLTPAEFTGGTFCVSNLGMLGVTRFAAIINPPNAAILAIGSAVKKPVVKQDQIVIADAIALTLSCDHRAIDGAIAARFLTTLKGLLEVPALLLV